MDVDNGRSGRSPDRRKTSESFIVIDIDTIRIIGYQPIGLTRHLVRDSILLYINRMKHYFIVLVILLTMLIMYLMKQVDGFEDVNPVVQEKYKKFVAFYNPFQVNWKKAITSSAASDVEIQPLSSPDQTSSGSAPSFSLSELNAKIEGIARELNKPLPYLTEPLPPKLDMALIKSIQLAPEPYINAMKWMNGKLEESHANMESALQGKKPEGFADMCQQIDQCNQQQQARLQQQQLSQQQQLGSQFDQITMNPTLQQSWKSNQALIAKSNNIQNQAQSGELMSQIDLPSEPKIKYTLPAGSNKWKDMKENDPEKAREYEKNYGQWTNLKSWSDQINRNL
jgi:hypothetical protein